MPQPRGYGGCPTRASSRPHGLLPSQPGGHHHSPPPSPACSAPPPAPRSRSCWSPAPCRLSPPPARCGEPAREGEGRMRTQPSSRSGRERQRPQCLQAGVEARRGWHFPERRKPSPVLPPARTAPAAQRARWQPWSSAQGVPSSPIYCLYPCSSSHLPQRPEQTSPPRHGAAPREARSDPAGWRTPAAPSPTPHLKFDPSLGWDPGRSREGPLPRERAGEEPAGQQSPQGLPGTGTLLPRTSSFCPESQGQSPTPLLSLRQDRNVTEAPTKPQPIKGACSPSPGHTEPSQGGE